MTEKLIKVAVPMTGEEEAERVREVIFSGNFVSGSNVKEFETRFADYIGTADAAAVNSGTAALHIALAVLEVGPGDEVIVPALTFFSTVSAVLYQNATPVFADVERSSICISAADLKNKITARTKAVIPVHLFGNAADMDEIMRIADEHNIYVIEDCAQAHGTEYKGRKVGSIGDLGAFSFFATKHMTTGEGGMVTSDRSDLVKRAQIIRNHGLINRDDHVCLGYNYRMNEIAAAMGLVQLSKLDQFNETRITNSLLLLKEIGNKEGKWFRIPELSEEVRHTFFWCPLIVNTEEGFVTADVVGRLKERGIEVRQRYQEPLYKQKVIQDLSPYPKGCPFTCESSGKPPDYKSLCLPNVEALAGNIIGLPNHPALTESDLEYIVEAVLSLY